MKTALYDRHLELGAKLVPFAGWEMPVHYQQGIIKEHQAVRQAVGLFDVSHMGRILVFGPDAEPFLDYLSTNRIAGKADGSATYTVWCHESGGAVDDVLVYKEDSEHFFVIVNASNRQKDLAHLLTYQHLFRVHIQDRFQGEGILALQGPSSDSLLSQFFPQLKTLKAMHFMKVSEQPGQELLISRTGYTGEKGFELYGATDQIVNWWDRLIKEGQAFHIEPVGLGARDTLRLEMGFALYGHELSDQIAPSESVSAWTIKWDKKQFLGKKALEELETSSRKRGEYGIKLLSRGIPREGYSIWQGDIQIGTVTSGSFSPTLNQGIALILVDRVLKEGELVEVEIRQQRSQAQVTHIPFIRKKT